MKLVGDALMIDAESSFGSSKKVSETSENGEESPRFGEEPRIGRASADRGNTP